MTIDLYLKIIPEKEERNGERERVEKKKWSTPQLIVLVRGKPEEGVLDICKGTAFSDLLGWDKALRGCFKAFASPCLMTSLS